MAGTRTDLMIVASTRIAMARPKPNCWNVARSPTANPMKTATMMSAAPVMMADVERNPNAIDSSFLPV